LQYKLFTLLFLLSSNLFILEAESIHSSLSSYYEIKNYTHSKQKEDGDTVGVGADLHYKDSMYKLAYEYARANTYQPPLEEDLKNQKLFLQYGYNFNNKFTGYLNYINILDDNIAITSNGKVYGAKISYAFDKSISALFAQYYTDYRDFNVAQSDFKIEYKASLKSLHYKLTAIGKYIAIDEEQKIVLQKMQKITTLRQV
jgi:hypothetical protein